MGYNAITLDAYQAAASRTAIYPGQGTFAGLTYVVLGINGEAGEIANKLKKVLRDEAGELSQEKREVLRDELSDCCWYLAGIASELGYSLGEIADLNLRKLASRQERGVLQGSGDDR